MSRYEDIINLPHHVSKNRRPMPMENRAAQFAPFAALVGYDDAISKATRLTDARTMLSSDEMEELSQCLNQALENITERDSYTFIYFIPDNKKSGGKYETVTGIIKSFNEYERTIKLENGDILRIDDIVSISGEVFDKD